MILLVVFNICCVYINSGLHALQGYTDHILLTVVYKFLNNNWRRTLAGLKEYTLEIHHTLGCDNTVADALSRYWLLLYTSPQMSIGPLPAKMVKKEVPSIPMSWFSLFCTFIYDPRRPVVWYAPWYDI